MKLTEAIISEIELLHDGVEIKANAQEIKTAVVEWHQDDDVDIKVNAKKSTLLLKR